MGESSKSPKSWTLENQNLKLAVCLQNIQNFKYNGQIPSDKGRLNQKNYYNLQNSAFWGWLSMESQPQNPEFRNNPENFRPWFVEFGETVLFLKKKICCSHLRTCNNGLTKSHFSKWKQNMFYWNWLELSGLRRASSLEKKAWPSVRMVMIRNSQISPKFVSNAHKSYCIPNQSKPANLDLHCLKKLCTQLSYLVKLGNNNYVLEIDIRYMQVCF